MGTHKRQIVCIFMTWLHANKDHRLATISGHPNADFISSSSIWRRTKFYFKINYCDYDFMFSRHSFDSAIFHIGSIMIKAHAGKLIQYHYLNQSFRFVVVLFWININKYTHIAQLAYEIFTTAYIWSIRNDANRIDASNRSVDHYLCIRRKMISLLFGKKSTTTIVRYRIWYEKTAANWIA